jgi:protein phosphatase PTC7
MLRVTRNGARTILWTAQGQQSTSYSTASSLWPTSNVGLTRSTSSLRTRGRSSTSQLRQKANRESTTFRPNRTAIHSIASTSISSYKVQKSSFSSSSCVASSAAAVHAVTGYAFAGKPRTSEAEEEKQRQYVGGGFESPKQRSKSKSAPEPRQGFPSNSTIGSWVDQTLRNGEAGEDALLFEKMQGDGDVIFGVADGVGGWSENGIDPALFSQSLMFHSATYARNFYACPERLEMEELEDNNRSGISMSSSASRKQNRDSTVVEPGTPLDVLEYAFQKTQEQVEVPAGSATACLVSFDSSKGVIRTANLGDSGFLILRPSVGTAEESGSETGSSGMLSVHYQSKPQTHGFNTPLQLSKLPPEYRFEGSIDSKPSNADLWSGRVLDGDMVLVATDGFWDNVSVKEVLQLVKFIQDKHRDANMDRMLDISSNPLAEETELANVLAQK